MTVGLVVTCHGNVTKMTFIWTMLSGSGDIVMASQLGYYSSSEKILRSRRLYTLEDDRHSTRILLSRKTIKIRETRFVDGCSPIGYIAWTATLACRKVSIKVYYTITPKWCNWAQFKTSASFQFAHSSARCLWRIVHQTDLTINAWINASTHLFSSKRHTGHHF